MNWAIQILRKRGDSPIGRRLAAHGGRFSNAGGCIVAEARHTGCETYVYKAMDEPSYRPGAD